MSGVIVDDVQWEHCNVCAKWVRLDNLGYETPSPAHEHGRDICLACTNAHADIESIVPAAGWIGQYDNACHPAPTGHVGICTIQKPGATP